VLLLILAGTGTALATGLGAIPVFLLGAGAERLRPALWGIAAGVMAVASVLGLLKPAIDEGSAWAVGGGLVAGIAFLAVADRLLRDSELHVGQLAAGDARTAVLVFAVLFVHSLPEGLAIGTAYASDTAGLGLFVILAIAIQNVPEGTSVAIPMSDSGFTRSQQFWAAVATSAPQPFGAVIAYVAVDRVAELLPASFAFAAGAMLALVVAQLLPRALAREGRGRGTAGLLTGGGLMGLLALLLGV
jgi:ZIP family zinc transporter